MALSLTLSPHSVLHHATVGEDVYIMLLHCLLLYDSVKGESMEKYEERMKDLDTKMMLIETCKNYLTERSKDVLHTRVLHCG